MLRSQFQLAAHPDFNADWAMLRRRYAEVTGFIDERIGGVAYLPRDTERSSVASVLSSSRGCVLTGESGSGKSALAKRLSTISTLSVSGYLMI